MCVKLNQLKHRMLLSWDCFFPFTLEFGNCGASFMCVFVHADQCEQKYHDFFTILNKS